MSNMKKFIQVVFLLLNIIGQLKCIKLLPLTLFLTFLLLFFAIATYNYSLSKYLCELLSPNLPNEFYTKDTFTFMEELKEASINDKFLVSYDDNSLYTNILLKERIRLAVDLIKTSYPTFKKSSDNLTKLFKSATCETHFLFNGKLYNQIDGVTMESPLAPVLASLFMGHNKKLWIENFQKTPSSYYMSICPRYVDDIFSVFNNSFESKNFLIISVQDTLTLSLQWRLKLIKSFLFWMSLLTIAKIF